MSTNVSISVSGNGGEDDVLARNRQQISANRQAKLEKDNSNEIEIAGKEQRTRRRRAIGAASSGTAANDTNPYGTPFIPTAPQKELAATPSRRTGFLLVPHQTYTDVGIAAKTANIKNKNFNYRFLNGDIFTIGFSRHDFISSGGPNDAPYLRPPHPPQDDVSTAGYIDYVVCNNTDVVASGNLPVQIRTSNGDIITPTQVAKPIHTLKNYTCECFLYVPYIPPIDPSVFPPQCIEADGSVSPFCNYLYTYPSTAAGAFLRVVEVGEIQDTVYRFFEFYIDSNASLRIRNMGKVYQTFDYEVDRWHHIAVSVSNDIATFYINGNSVEPTQIIPGNWENVHELPSNTIATAGIATNIVLGTGLTPFGAFYSGIHGFRFTARTLYTGPFTPPSSITSLA